MKWHVIWNVRAERGLQKSLDETGALDEVVIAAEEMERLLESDDQLVFINAFWRWAK